jgi:hypothetical protein
VTERGIDRVRIALSCETVTIPWESRQALLDRLRRVESLTGVVEAFEAVGTSRPVELDSLPSASTAQERPQAHEPQNQPHGKNADDYPDGAPGTPRDCAPWRQNLADEPPKNPAKHDDRPSVRHVPEGPVEKWEALRFYRLN